MLRIDDKVFALVDSGEIDDLKIALQYAIELEHSTMPPYLYAMYSLKNSTSPGNKQIAAIIKQIVREEMLHMLLACNMLKAIGGNPVIDSPSFVPSFPTHLPGTVAQGLVVPLKPFSLDVAENVFMGIEEPENILEFKTREFAMADPPKTIGEFYGRIKKTFEELGDDLIVDTTGDTQPSTPFFGVNQKITSAAKAIDAIDVIVEQGEGTTTDPHFPDGDNNADNDKLAHYYRFAELVKGKIKKNPDATPDSPPEEKYFYDANDRIEFDAGQVLQLPDNPKSTDYPEGSAARTACDNFNRIYTNVLKHLHEAFNGEPVKLGTAIFIMGNEMVSSARAITQISISEGKFAGPTFEYLPG